MNEDNPTKKQLHLAGPMSSRDFAAWGVEDVAYVRKAVIDGTDLGDLRRRRVRDRRRARPRHGVCRRPAERSGAGQRPLMRC